MKEKINTKNTFLGIEFGSTRIKACLIDDTFTPITDGSFEWENKFENGYWTYSNEEILNGLRGSFSALSDNVLKKYGVTLTTVGAMGISGMMHGYLAFDENDNLLVPFRTWRNTTTKQASTELTELFNFNIPQRWSIAHLYQAILNNEEHIGKISYITTLAGYIHYLLTGKHEVGIGEASGIFPVNGNTYDASMLKKFNDIISDKFNWSIYDILPAVKPAGEKGGFLTEEGAKLLDPTGTFKAGIPLCPPEGDAGTGMVATNSVKQKTGNISAGTSAFSMVVLEKQLKNKYSEIDMVTTPDGLPVAMVHCNNCCGELDRWVNMFFEFSKLMGMSVDKSDVYERLYNHTLLADADCGGVVSYNYISGEHITGVENGYPMHFTTKESKMTLSNFIKSQLYSLVSSLKIGMDILFEEGVMIDEIKAHGGLFKVKGVAQQILSDAINTNVSVTDTAGEGGAWGMALLAAYMMQNAGASLDKWLENNVFKTMKSSVTKPNEDGVSGFSKYMDSYKKGILVQKLMGEILC